jgi:BASS family bile acid:Na+ symporter
MIKIVEDFIKKYTGILLIVACGVGLLFPQLNIFKDLIFYILLLLLFCSFLKIEFNLKHFINPKLLLFPLFNWFLLPLLVYFISRSLIPDYRIGLLFAIITPPALGSPVIISITKGDLEFMMSNVMIYNLLSPIAYTLIPVFLFKDDQIFIPVKPILLRVVTVVMIPLVLALIVRTHKRSKDWIITHIDSRKNILQIFMVSVAVASASLRIRQTPLSEIGLLFLITFSLTLISYGSGYFISRKNPVMQRTLPVAMGHKNTLLAIMICITNFSPIAALPTVFYLFSHHIFNGILIQISARKDFSEASTKL